MHLLMIVKMNKINPVPKPRRKDRWNGKKNQEMNVSEFKKHVLKEEDLQRVLEAWLDIEHINYFRIPDIVYTIFFTRNQNGKLFGWLAAVIKLIPIGVRNIVGDMFGSFPDLAIFSRGKKYNRVLFLELKSKKGKMSQGQKTFAKLLNVAESRNFEHAQKVVNEFLNSEEIQ